MQYIESEELTQLLAAEDEIAIVDVRLQEEFIREQLLASVNIPYDRLDLEAPTRIPRLTVPIVIVAADDASSEQACLRLQNADYSRVSVLKGGIAAWKTRGQPTFEDVNAESKAFGEYIEHAYGTPNVEADWLHEKLRSRWNGVVVDCRPLREHAFAHVPGAVHIPGGDLYRALPCVAPDPDVPVVVHCGGRTRGIIAAQGLINAGFDNPVSVLRNGTMGWHLAGYDLAQGSDSENDERLHTFRSTNLPQKVEATIRGHGVDEIDVEEIRTLISQRHRRTLYVFDLRTPRVTGDDNIAGVPVTAGQLVQATDEFIAVRGARVVLVDEDFARAHMTAAWLRQMGWRDTFVHMANASTRAAVADALPHRESDDAVDWIGADQLDEWLRRGQATVVDVSQSHEYVAGHVPGAGFCPRSSLASRLADFDSNDRQLVLASKNVALSVAAARDLHSRGYRVRVLEDGNDSWTRSGRTLTLGAERLYCETSWLNEAFRRATTGQEELVKAFVEWELERFFDPFEFPRIEDAMMKYLNWEIDLVNEWQSDVSVKFGRFQAAGRQSA